MFIENLSTTYSWRPVTVPLLFGLPAGTIQPPRQRIAVERPASRNLRSVATGAGGSWEQLLSLNKDSVTTSMLQVLSAALELLSGRLRGMNGVDGDRDRVCNLSYADGNKQYTPLPAAVRQAFADLEKDDDDEEALNTLCLLTYSEDECAQSSSSSSNQEYVSTSAAATAAYALLSSESITGAADQSAIGTMMETLCLLSYDESV